MPEPLDFARIARDLATRLDRQQRRDLLVMDIAERLRQAWNARGAADIEVSLGRTDIERAIRSLDR